MGFVDASLFQGSSFSFSLAALANAGPEGEVCCRGLIFTIGMAVTIDHLKKPFLGGGFPSMAVISKL